MNSLTITVPWRDFVVQILQQEGLHKRVVKEHLAALDTFLAERSLSSHLVVIPTTRSVRKSNETIATLRKHLARTAASDSLRARGVASPQDAIDRVHITSVQLDL